MPCRRSITKLARELRKRQTPAEKILWHELRSRKLQGVKFFRQHSLIYEEDRGHLHFFIADFYSAEQKLVIELDGKIHDYQKHYDYERDLVISEMGLKVVRFKNEEVRDMDRLKAKICSHFT
jgi:very-short-patch-repair endonuclease